MRKLQFKISLANSHIPIWRQFQITDDYRLDRFHQVLQIIMGWWNAHLHEFQIGGRRFGMLLTKNEADLEDETRFFLKNFPFKIGQKVEYLYDLGDNWEHTLIVEKIENAPKSELKCLSGNGKCPFEDAGGVKGYANILKAQSDPTHPAHQQSLGNHTIHDLPNYAAFDLKATNRELRKFSLWHSKHPSAVGSRPPSTDNRLLLRS